jgi:hypothetical protein
MGCIFGAFSSVKHHSSANMQRIPGRPASYAGQVDGAPARSSRDSAWPHRLPIGALSSLPAASQQILTGREFFPELISAPFHQGLSIVFGVAAALALVAGVASLLRGGRYIYPASADEAPEPVTGPLPAGRALPAGGQGRG